jgi:hypothetical protein
MEFPSFDFELFRVPFFSPLQAQEFGATTSYQANTPVAYADYSLSQLFNQVNPQTQESATTLRDRLIRVKNEAEEQLKILDGGTDCPQGRNIFGGCGPIFGSKPIISDGQKAPVGDDPLHTGAKANSIKQWWDALPQGAGIFLIAVIAAIALLLFARR